MWTQILVTHLGLWDNFVDRDVGFCCFWPCRKAPERKPFCERLPPEAPAPQGPASPSSPSKEATYDDVALPSNRALSPGASHSYSYDGVTVPPKAPTGRPLPELPNDVSAVDESVYDDVQVPSVDAPAGYPLKKKASALDVSQGPSEAIYEELDSPKKQTSKN
ncbi:unnamed protein product [Ixodes hexagonus]